MLTAGPAERCIGVNMNTMSAKPMNANIKLAVWWTGLVVLYATVALQLSFFFSLFTHANIDWPRTFVVTNSPSQPLVTFHDPFAALFAADGDHRWLPMCSLVAAIALIRYLHLQISICAGDRNRLQALKNRPVAQEGKTYFEMKAEHERLGALMRASGVITDEQLRQAQDLSNRTQRFLGDCFVSFAWVTIEQLADAQLVQEKFERELISADEAKALLLSQKIMHDVRKAEMLARKRAEAEEQEEVDHYEVAAAKLKANPVAIPSVKMPVDESCESTQPASQPIEIQLSSLKAVQPSRFGVAPFRPLTIGAEIKPVECDTASQSCSIEPARPEEPALWTLEASDLSKKRLQMAIESGENEIGHQRQMPFAYHSGFDYAAGFPALPKSEAEFGFAWNLPQTLSAAPIGAEPIAAAATRRADGKTIQKTAKLQPRTKLRKKGRQQR
jgi:hypothetical protein